MFVRDDFGPDRDVDLVATYAPEAHWSLLDRVRTKLELESLLGCRVDCSLGKDKLDPAKTRPLPVRTVGI